MTKHFFFLFTSVYNVGPHFNLPLNLGSQYQTNFKILTYFYILLRNYDPMLSKMLPQKKLFSILVSYILEIQVDTEP